MSLQQYELKYFTSTGGYMLSFEDVQAFQYTRVKNDVGVAVVDIPGTYPMSLFQSDYRLEVHRFNALTGQHELQGDTCWFLVKAEKLIEDDGNSTITLTFQDTIGLLARRIVAWHGKDIFNYPSIMLEAFDDIISLIFYYNFGDGTVSPTAANAGIGAFTPSSLFSGNPGLQSWQLQVYNSDMVLRQFPITLQPPASLAVATPNVIRFDMEDCLSAMQEVSNAAAIEGENVWFDVVYTPATTTSAEVFTFRTWVGIRGQDRSAGTSRVTIGPEYGNISNASITKDWESHATIAYVGGNGDNDLRTMNSVTTGEGLQNPFYPKEIFVNASNSDNTAALIAEANAALFENRASITFGGTLVSRPPTEFGRDFNYGDLVFAEFEDVQEPVEVSEYQVVVDDGGEEITIPFGSS